MTLGWASRDRLAPMRMVDVGYNDHKFEIVKWKRRSLRAYRRELQSRPRVDVDRERRRLFPGRTGNWPLWSVNGNRRPIERAQEKKRGWE